MADSNTTQDNGFLQKMKESPRTISAIIIILIVAAAIYAFSDQPQPEQAREVPNQEESQEAVATEEGNEEPADEQASAENPATTPTPASTEATATPGTAVTPEELNTAAEALPESQKTDQGYEEVAQAGDGLTHIARRATTRWLSENSSAYAVTNEHRIYIEDYIQKKLGSKRLGVGDQQLISFDLVKEAVDHAQSLNSSQLQNLSQYTHVLQ